MAKRPRLGDLIEIPLKKRKKYAYAQYVYNDRNAWGPLLRILPGTYRKHLCEQELNALSSQPELYVTFLSLGTVVNQNLVSIVGNAEIPPQFDKLPLFKSPGVIDEERGRVKTWYLWDGIKSWRVRKMTEKIRNLPIRSLPNLFLVVERIEKGWMPADEVD